MIDYDWYQDKVHQLDYRVVIENTHHMLAIQAEHN